MKYPIAFIATSGLLVAACGGGGSGDAPAPANAAPTVAAIAEQSIPANQASEPIAVTVSDENANDLDVMALSSDQDVVNDSALALNGRGTNRRLVVTPAVDTLGDTMITVTATDRDGLYASSSFLVSVEPTQQSIQQFTRRAFAQGPDADPEFINAIAFNQDANQDDFDDLLGR